MSCSCAKLGRMRLMLSVIGFAVTLGAQQQTPAQASKHAPERLVRTSKPKAGEIVINRKDGLSYVYIPPGQFHMGCSEGDSDCLESERPPHKVRIPRGFWMGQIEVTVEAYKRYIRSTGKLMPAEPKFLDKNMNPGWNIDGEPMSIVSWRESQGYCEWAGLRLPTESQWEYAARAGSNAARYGVLEDIAWYGDNSGSERLDTRTILKADGANYAKRLIENGNRPHPPGQKQANAFKLSDMLGNVWEWTADWYSDTSYKKPSQAPSGREQRVLRGGSWDRRPGLARASTRYGSPPSERNLNVGFRCSGEKLVP